MIIICVKNGYWSDEELKYLADNWKTSTVEQISKKLNRNENTTRSKLREIKLAIPVKLKLGKRYKLLLINDNRMADEYITGKCIAVYPKFYLIETKNYKTTIPKRFSVLEYEEL